MQQVMQAIPVVNRLLSCKYDAARQVKQIELGDRLLRTLRALEDARDRASLVTHQEKLRESHGKRLGEKPNETWVYESPEKELAYTQGIIQIMSKYVELVLPRIYAGEIDGSPDAEGKLNTILDLDKPLTLGERQCIDWFMEYADQTSQQEGEQ
jgi:hypothetical protein